MTWSREKDLKVQVQKLWNKGQLLSTSTDDSIEFPKRLAFKTPSSTELVEHFDAVRQWISSLQNIKGFRIESRTVRHRVLGENSVPSTAWLDTLDNALHLLGKHREFQQFSRLVAQTRERHPALMPWVQKQPLKTLAVAEQWPQFLDLIDWLKANPRPQMYLRQVDIPGIDSKFIETYRSILMPLLDLALPAASIHAGGSGIAGFARRYGFLSKPPRVRLRILDPALALLPGPDQDISLTARDFRLLYKHPALARVRQVFITENEINFLAFPPRENSLVLFGAGYGFEELADVPWLFDVAVRYWGDIDTHGFIILDQLRHKLPHAQSLLMDESTLLAHRDFWGQENKPENRPLQRLTAAEHCLYQDLVNARFGERLRLEQERVGFEYVRNTLDK